MGTQGSGRRRVGGWACTASERVLSRRAGRSSGAAGVCCGISTKQSRYKNQHRSSWQGGSPHSLVTAFLLL